MILPRSYACLSSHWNGAHRRVFMPISRSVIMKIGVCSRSARSNALAVNSKHSVGSSGNSSTCLVSPCDAYAQAVMSDCWVRVGMPVDGPPRCTSTITAGISAKYARPMNSVISEMPGPDVAVNARAPFQPAPITMPIDASSSSAWTIANLLLPVAGSTRYFWQYLMKASASEDDGVIGYQAQTVAPP